MEAECFVKILGSDFYTGVPDSQLKALCDCLINRYGIDPRHHVIAANEGNCVALATGYYLATGKVPVVYMQNSGEGNAINPIASLTNEKVYSIPMLFVIGWRGEPGVHDEPQHIYQGQITEKLLDIMDIDHAVVSKNTTEEAVRGAMERFRNSLRKGKSAAFIVKKGALEFKGDVDYTNRNHLCREEIIRQIVKVTGQDPIVCTTGKASRELFEIREENGQSHEMDFLTVGSMGHSSSIALEIAVQKPEKKVWCIDGDGAVIMHMGAMAVIGASAPENLVHIVINNEAHETVGGMPTVAGTVDFVTVAKACGYINTASAGDLEELRRELQKAKESSRLTFLEVKCAIGARANLGRPTTSPVDNRDGFMKYLAMRV